MSHEKFPNPFRVGSKMQKVFHFLADGEYHSIQAITNAVYFPGAGSRALYRRRVASSIRTIRRGTGSYNLPRCDVRYDCGTYQMIRVE